MSKRKMNNKGMTLVEIVIVLLIASIAMTITGGILINSLGYFQDTTELSTDKTAGDGVLDFIKNEIQYSTKVSVQRDIPSDEDWHSLYIQDDQLYKDDDPVFTKTDTKKGDYYGNRKLEIETNCFNNGYRMDMKIYLNTGSGTNKETKYKVTHTFEFLNLKKDKNSGSTTTTFWNTDKGTLSTVYKLWYIKDASAITPDKDDDKKDDNKKDDEDVITGTVADQLKFLSVWNTKNDFDGKKAYPTRAQEEHMYCYEFVFRNGYWWQSIVNTDYYNGGTEALSNFKPGDGPGETYKFKKMDAYFSDDSAYEKGDIVIYDGKRYVCKATLYNVGNISQYAGYHPLDGSWIGNNFWRLADESDYKNADGTIKDGTSNIDESRYDYLQNKYKDTVVKKLNGIDLSKVKELDVNKSSSISTVKDPQHPQQDEVYKITSYDDGGHPYIKYYIKLFNNGTSPECNINQKFDWQLLTTEFTENSAYAYQDCIWYSHYGFREILECTNTNGVNQNVDIITDKHHPNDYWKILNQAN